MKLSQNTIDWIKTATQIAADLGVDGLIFDKDGIHGYDDEDAIIVACFENLNFEFETMGIAAIPEFRRKLKIIEDRGELGVEARYKKEGDESKVSSLKISGRKIKYDFRCTDPSRIRDLPKKSLTVDPVFTFGLNAEEIKTFKDASTALRNKNVVVRGKDGQVQFTFSDESGDTMDYTLDSPLTSHTTEKEFAMVLAVQKMHKIFRKAESAHEDSVTVNILKNMIVHLNIYGIDVVIMSEV